MKKRYAFVGMLTLSMFACLPTKAQSPYRPFPESNAGWMETHSWLQGAGGSGYEWHTCQRRILFGSDTMIAGTNYHRLRSWGDCSVQPIPPTSNPSDYYNYLEPWTDVQFFRQDIPQRKVYCWDTNTASEMLWYDLSLPVGGYPYTFNAHFGPNALEVVALDSMELNDGWHRAWVLGFVGGNPSDSAFCKVIEGIGSTYGLFAELITPFENAEQLDCHQVSGQTTYPLGAFPCIINVGSDEPPVTLGTELFAQPNPTSGHIRLTGELPKQGSYAVFSIAGDLVAQGSITSADLDLTDLAPGIYSVIINGHNGRRVGRVLVLRSE